LLLTEHNFIQRFSSLGESHLSFFSLYNAHFNKLVTN
jgi:hypothetical protein